jgi:uncharacterized protein YrrD
MTYRSIKLLSHYTILAKDGEIGKIHDFFFDDTTWTIRYLVVDTRRWLPGRKVLISPVAVGKTDWGSKQFVLNLTRDQVRKSPDINTDKPISLQRQIELHDYYVWPYYWATGGFVPVYPPPVMPPPEKKARQTAQSDAERHNPYLRSTKEVIGYHIQARDGEIDHVEDFLIDEKRWVLCYMVVDTRNWLPGRKVLVSPEWIKYVIWTDKKLSINLTKEMVKNGPEYSPTEPMS